METAYCADRLRPSHSSSQLQYRDSRSTPKTRENALDISPRFSYSKPTTNQDKMLHRRYSLNLQEHLPGHRFRTTAEKTEKATSKSIAELVGEIATLEHEVMRKELHLLSLYRAAFEQYVAGSCSDSSQADQETLHDYSLKKADEGALRLRDMQQSAAFNLPTLSDSKSELSRSFSEHYSLANFLSASISDYIPKISCKLSEDIIRCISAVYCKLASPAPSRYADSETSPTPSVSSSSTVSPKHRNNSWSPRCHHSVAASPCTYGWPKENDKQYGGMIIVPRIHINAEKFDYASKMLDTIRSLIQRLEKIDPTKMAHEEQLCFWINIHNALVMHAFLAYGLHGKRMKNTDMVLKVAYNVGGKSVNAQIIQNSILGCQSHRPSLWVHALFTPMKKSTTGTSKHPYALRHSEPLAHFALSAGAFSDPPVRLYRAKKINHQLELARIEFIQANVVAHKQTILLPKVLHYYAKDAAIELLRVVEMVCDSMSETQQKEIKHCLRRRIDKCVEWLPYKSSFRYIVHRDLAE